MSTAAPSKEGVSINLDPVPDFVDGIQMAWNQTVLAREIFLAAIGGYETQLTAFFPITESYEDNRITGELKLGSDDLFKVGEKFLRLMIERAKELFTKTSVKLDIDSSSYKKMLTEGLYVLDDRGHATDDHPEEVDFGAIWRQLEQDFAGEKGETKTYQEAANNLVNNGWNFPAHYRKKGKDEWIAKSFTKQKKCTVLRVAIQTEPNFSGGAYGVSYDCRQRIADYFLRGLQVLADQFGDIHAENFRYMCKRITEVFWQGHPELQLGQSWPFEGMHWSLTVVLRKHNLELKMNHELADMIVAFADEHFFQLHKGEGKSDDE